KPARTVSPPAPVGAVPRLMSCDAIAASPLRRECLHKRGVQRVPIRSVRCDLIALRCRVQPGDAERRRPEKRFPARMITKKVAHRSDGSAVSAYRNRPALLLVVDAD